MAKEYAKKLYKSTVWKKCRKSYFKLWHGLCERCKGTRKIVHYKDHNRQNNSISNLEVMSFSEHTRMHNEKKKSSDVKGQEEY
ncbi:HNH endonuclease [Bacillus pseudomycoides]|nr:HNH endonuclease [Bacillus pseudomycoides]PGF06483.1 HNH endonuclease [Bacillus pseudomycoides]